MNKAVLSFVLSAVFVSNTPVAAADDLQKQADPHVRKTIEETIGKLESHPVHANEAQTTEAIKLLAELGELGPDAAPAVPFLLSEEFFLIKGGYTSTDKPLRLATIDTLIKIGKPAVPEVVKLLSMPSGRNHFEWKWWGGEILRKMSRTELVDAIIPILGEEMRGAANKGDYHSLLASMGPKSTPVLQQEARDIVAKGNITRADSNNLRRLGSLIGGEIGEAIDAVIPAHYTGETWKDERYWIHYRGGWYPLAHASAGSKHIPALLDLIQNDTLIQTRQYEGMRYIGMILSTMGEAPALPLAELLTHEKLETRWAAAFILTMIGADARAALPALEKTFANKDEDIGVRVAAARAIARIKGTRSSDLYEQIPDVEQKMVAAAGRRSEIAQSREQWQYHFANDTSDSKPRHLHLYKKTPEHEKALYCLAAGEDLHTQNQWLRAYTADLLSGKNKAESEGGGTIDKDMNAFLFMFHSRSQHYPGRLEPDVETAMKEYAFRSVDINDDQRKNRYLTKTTEDLSKILACDDSVFIMEVDNGPIRSDANSYLILQTLNGDPKFRKRKFAAGDTVEQRYEAYTKFYQRGIRQWALNGLWVELGSSNYEYKTYRGLLNLVEFATDPVVATRARMWMDLSMVEIAQISLSGLRGGSKSRAKDGGLDGRFNRYLGMFYGEHHGYMLEPPGFKAYRPPEPAILLRRLGPTTPVYEIANRHPGEWKLAPEGIPQYRKMHTVHSHSINYAWRTPEYLTGCAMNDIRLWKQKDGKSQFAYGPLGRWSGVIFRDGSAVYLEAYTGEKWNVQSKDVMIAQRYKNSYYKGDARVDLVGSLDVVEGDGWVFADNDDAYAAVRIARGGYYWNEPARHRLYLEDQYSPILIQTGRQAVYESFEKFQDAILAARITLTEDKLDYTGPNSKRIEFFMCKDSDVDPYPKRLPLIDATELDLELEHSYRSPFMKSEVGSEVVTIRYGSRQWNYDFAKDEVIEVTQLSRPDQGGAATPLRHVIENLTT